MWHICNVVPQDVRVWNEELLKVSTELESPQSITDFAPKSLWFLFAQIDLRKLTMREFWFICFRLRTKHKVQPSTVDFYPKMPIFRFCIALLVVMKNGFGKKCKRKNWWLSQTEKPVECSIFERNMFTVLILVNKNEEIILDVCVA